jgi:hypothetical protein
MSNHVFNSESSEDLYYLYSENNNGQTGGKNNSSVSTEPRGGFPPIFIVEHNNAIVQKTQNRELNINKTAVSIKTLLQNRLKINP